MAETIRSRLEELSANLGVNCSVLAKIRGNAVLVLAANGASATESTPLGHRQPIIPPLGAVFMVNATPPEIDEWLKRSPDDSPDRRDRYRALLDQVRERGYSVLAAVPDLLRRHQAALPAMALRMTGLPSAVPAEQIETWVDSLKRIADAAALDGPRRRDRKIATPGSPP